MLELVLYVGVSILSEATDISNDEKIKEVFE